MSKQPLIFDVNQQGFEQYALLNSYKVPVVVEFMAIWSGPCVLLSDMYTELAREFAEEFIFARVDIDEQQELRKQYNIENLPTTIVFKDGQPVRTEQGQLSEDEARSLLKDFGVCRESDLMREQAREKHLSGDSPGAILLLTEAIKKDPGNIRVAMDMTQVLIDIKEYDQAFALFDKLPEQARKTEMGKALVGQISFIKLASKTEGRDALEARLASNDQDMDARFDLAICMMADYQFVEASEGLFRILEEQIDYKDGAAREMISVMSNMLATTMPELSQTIRRRLSNMIAS